MEDIWMQGATVFKPLVVYSIFAFPFSLVSVIIDNI